MRILVLTLLLVACRPNRGVDDAPEGPQPGHPDLQCPPGTSAAGYAPPLANEVWCRRQDAAGQWLRHGPAIVWHRQYARKAAGAYFDGVKNGAWTYWHEGGGLHKTEQWDMGKLDGQFIEYHDNGQLAAQGMMVDGLEEGEWTYWSANGTLERTGSYLHGEMDGPWTIYDEDGSPRTQRTYRNGRLRFQEEL